MKKQIAFLAFIFCCIQASAQTSFSYSAGLATYSLADLKGLQSEYVRNVPEIPVKAVTTFPAYLFYNGQLEMQATQKLFFGFSLGFYSTGARNHLADYSGEYSLDMPLKSFRTGFHVKAGEVILRGTRKLSFMPRFETGIRNSKLVKKESLNIAGFYSYFDSSAYSSRNFYIEPSIICQMEIFKNVKGFVSMGWEQDFGSKLFLKGKDGEWLKNGDEKTVKLNMSGLRISIGVSYMFLPHFPFSNAGNPQNRKLE